MKTPTPSFTSSHKQRRAHPLALGLSTAMALALLVTAGSALPAVAVDPPPQTVVSITFDDSTSDQMAAEAALKAHSMQGTFFINSGNVNEPGYLTTGNLATIAGDGNEIGGHTVSHPDLALLSATEAKRQICLDRANLLGWGYNVRSFAYPFASITPALESLVQDCGYNSARGLGDIKSPDSCADCDTAATLPVPSSSLYDTAAPDEYDSTWSLTDLQNEVINAENGGGGWLQLTFHRYCSASTCAGEDLAIDPALFTQFLDWLQLRSASNNTVVKTVGDVVGGTAKAAVTVPADAPTTDPSGLHNPGFETLDSSTPAMPTCWQFSSFGTNTVTASTVSPGRTGQVAVKIAATAIAAGGDAKMLQTFDLGTCSTPVTPGKTYSLSQWFTSTGNTQFEIYLRTTAGGWKYWTASPQLLPQSTWTQDSFTTAAIPTGYTAISFGLTIAAPGTLTVDDAAISLSDKVPTTTATVSPASPNGSAGWYTTAPTVTLTADTPALPTTTEFAFGSAALAPYTAPFTISSGSTTLSYRSSTPTKTEATKTAAFKVDTAAPTVTAAFNGANRTISVQATDTTSGVASVQQSTNGTTWAAYSGNGAAGDSARTVQYRALDVAGNISAVSSLSIPALPGTPVVNPPAPPARPAAAATTTLTIAAVPSTTFGHAGTVTIAATTTGAAASGPVAVLLDGKVIAAVPLAGGRVTVALPAGTTVGSHLVTASYAGTTTTTAASAPSVAFTVKKVAPTVKVSLSTTKPKAHHTKVKATVKVSIAKSTLAPTGKVSILIDGKAVKTTALTPGKHGRVTVTLPRFAATGAHTVRARLSSSPQATTTTSSLHRLRVVAR